MEINTTEKVKEALGYSLSLGAAIGTLRHPTRDEIESSLSMVIEYELEKLSGALEATPTRENQYTIIEGMCAKLTKDLNIYYTFTPNPNRIEVSDYKENSGDGVSFLVTRVIYLDSAFDIIDIESINSDW